MGKSNWLFAFGLLLIIVLAFGGYLYYHYQSVASVTNLDVQLSSIRIDQVSWTGTDLSFTLQIYNPNPITTKVGNFHAQFAANNQPLTRVALSEFDIAPGQTVEKTIPVRLAHLDVGMALLSAIREREVTWQADGAYTLILPFGMTYDYTFSLSSKSTSST